MKKMKKVHQNPCYFLGLCYNVQVCIKTHCFVCAETSGRRNLDLQLTTSRTQGGMSRGKKSRKNR
jgi:hypothetical protein